MAVTLEQEVQRTSKNGPVRNKTPLIKLLRILQVASGLSVRELSHRAGIDNKSIYGWYGGRDPRISHIGAVLNVLGYELRIVRKRDN